MLVTAISFGGIYIQNKGRMSNIIPEYSLGMDLQGSRKLGVIVDDSTNEVIYDKDGNVVTEEGEDTTTKEEPVNPEEVLTKENFEKTKEIINKPLQEERCLFERLLEYQEQHLLFIKNFEVPFDNNLSERGLRGAKSKQKASGQFWGEESASWYATIRTYIETCNRNNVNIYNALVMLCLGKPYTLKEILSGGLER